MTHFRLFIVNPSSAAADIVCDARYIANPSTTELDTLPLLDIASQKKPPLGKPARSSVSFVDRECFGYHSGCGLVEPVRRGLKRGNQEVVTDTTELISEFDLASFPMSSALRTAKKIGNRRMVWGVKFVLALDAYSDKIEPVFDRNEWALLMGHADNENMRLSNFRLLRECSQSAILDMRVVVLHPRHEVGPCFCDPSLSPETLPFR